MELFGRMHRRAYADGGPAGARRAWKRPGQASPPRSAWPADAGTGMDYGRPVARRARCAEDRGRGTAGTLVGDAAGGERAIGDPRSESAMELPGDAARVSRCRGAYAGN